MMVDRPLTVVQVADRFGVTTRSVYGWIRAGDLAAFRLPGGGEWRVRPETIAAIECPDESSSDPTIDSASAGSAGTSTGPTLTPASPDPFQRGKQTSAQQRFGAISG